LPQAQSNGALQYGLKPLKSKTKLIFPPFSGLSPLTSEQQEASAPAYTHTHGCVQTHGHTGAHMYTQVHSHSLMAPWLPHPFQPPPLYPTCTGRIPQTLTRAYPRILQGWTCISLLILECRLVPTRTWTRPELLSWGPLLGVGGLGVQVLPALPSPPVRVN
jgi:hypothetical protein